MSVKGVYAGFTPKSYPAVPGLEGAPLHAELHPRTCLAAVL